MKKIILLTLVISAVLVNLLAWLVWVYGEVYIGIMFRIALTLGITVISAIFSAAAALLGFLDTEKPNH